MTDPPTHTPKTPERAKDPPGDAVVLESQRPSHPATFRPRGGPPSAPSPVKIIHEAPGYRSGPSTARLAVGFVLVLAAIFVASTEVSDWRHWITDISAAIHNAKKADDSVANPPPAEVLPAEEPPAGEPPAWLTYIPWAGGAILLILGGLCLRSGIFSYLLTATWMSATALLANMLLEHEFDWLPWVLAGTTLAYLVHAVRREVKQSPAAIIGWALIGFSCLGIVRGWFDGTAYNWSFLGASWSEQTGTFFTRWESECAWGVVLLLTAIGVSLSRTKPIHFLNAILLAALAYYCLQEGKLAIAEYPNLARDGVIPTIAHESLKNIATWQWVLIGDFVLLSAIMLHLALGVGALTVAFATSWLLLGLQVDKAAWRMAVTRFAAGLAAQQIDRSTPSRPPASGPAESVVGNGGMGLPIGGGEVRPAATGARPTRPAASIQDLEEQMIRAVLPFIWVYLTAILAGIIGACGLRLWVERIDVRLWLMCALWLSFGLGVMWLYQHWPRYPDQPWSEGQWLIVWITSPYHIQAICLAALGPMAILGGWALRWNSSYQTWLDVAMISIMIGTALSLITMAVLIRYGGFAPKPAWSYAAIAAGQSSIMWVLLMHRSLRARRGAATALAG